MRNRGTFDSIDAIKTYLYAGRATLTIESHATKDRFTYKIAEKDGIYFVALREPRDDFRFIGLIRGKHTFRYSQHSTIPFNAPAVEAFKWFFDALSLPALPSSVSVSHEGSCGRCGRFLHTKQEIKTGIGGECSRKMGFYAEAAERDYYDQRRSA